MGCDLLQGLLNKTHGHSRGFMESPDRITRLGVWLSSKLVSEEFTGRE